MKRKGDLSQKDRMSAMADMVALKGVNKTGLARTLTYLHNHNLLTDTLASSAGHQPYYRQMARAIVQSASISTPYGTLAQKVKMPLEATSKFDAYLYICPYLDLDLCIYIERGREKERYRVYK